MEKLNSKFSEALDIIKNAIQGSEELATYLDTEEDADYLKLRDAYEPYIHELYTKIADSFPMQLLAFEERLLEEGFEGLYLPKILGYSILRGALNERYKFIRPQEHFKTVLNAISNSSNFDEIRLRIGQSLQTGFALSSDIWITNFIQSLKAKQARDFLQSQILPKFRDIKEREIAYKKYKRQFRDFNFFTAVFPQTKSELPTFYPELELFFVNRIELDKENSNLLPHLLEFIENKEFHGANEYVYVMGYIANYIPLDEINSKAATKAINSLRKSDPMFVKTYFRFLKQLLHSELLVDSDCNKRVSDLLDKKIDDDLTRYYNLMDIIHDKGWIHEEAIDTVREFYYHHEGLSSINECIRLTIYKLFTKVLLNLEVEDYSTLFELFKTISVYINIFSNKHFDQGVKKRSLDYVRKCLKVFTDKRGRDYQDIKKFIASTFVDLNLMTEKEVKEFFKTKRKKRPVSS